MGERPGTWHDCLPIIGTGSEAARQGTVAATEVVLLTLASGQFLMTIDSSVMNVSIAQTAEAIVDSNESARIAGLRLSLFVLALLAGVALFLTRLLPTEAAGTKQPGAAPPPSG